MCIYDSLTMNEDLQFYRRGLRDCLRFVRELITLWRFEFRINSFKTLREMQWVVFSALII